MKIPLLRRRCESPCESSPSLRGPLDRLTLGPSLGARRLSGRSRGGKAHRSVSCRVGAIEYSVRHGKSRGRLHLRLCPRSYGNERRRPTRARWIAAGGKCHRSGCACRRGALVFHHLNPARKRFNLATAGTRSMISPIAEIDTCELLYHIRQVKADAGPPLGEASFPRR